MNKTMKLWNAGYSKDEAIAKGADLLLWVELEDTYGHTSIPLNVLLGLKYSKPYSCDYHTGGVMGKQLRELVKSL